MLTGELPFKGGYPEALSHAIRTEDPPLPRARNADVSIDIDTFVLRALKRNPKERIQSAREMARGLRQLQGMTVPQDLQTQVIPISRRSIVVLPFVNLTEGDDYFSDGLTDEIITDLSSVRALRVISRTSSMRLKGTTDHLSEIAANLGVLDITTDLASRPSVSVPLTVTYKQDWFRPNNCY